MIYIEEIKEEYDDKVKNLSEKIKRLRERHMTNTDKYKALVIRHTVYQALSDKLGSVKPNPTAASRYINQQKKTIEKLESKVKTLEGRIDTLRIENTILKKKSRGDKKRYASKPQLRFKASEKVSTVLKEYKGERLAEVSSSEVAENVILKEDVRTFPFSTRIINVFEQYEIFQMGDLLQYSEEEIKEFRNFGLGCYLETKYILDQLNLRLRRV